MSLTVTQPPYPWTVAFAAGLGALCYLLVVHIDRELAAYRRHRIEAIVARIETDGDTSDAVGV